VICTRRSASRGAPEELRDATIAFHGAAIAIARGQPTIVPRVIAILRRSIAIVRFRCDVRRAPTSLRRDPRHSGRPLEREDRMANRAPAKKNDVIAQMKQAVAAIGKHYAKKSVVFGGATWKATDMIDRLARRSACSRRPTPRARSGSSRSATSARTPATFAS
jgi:hypothetical protein